MACSLASRSSRFAAALRADLDAISARHPKDPVVGTKSWLQSNKKLNVYLDTPNPHVSNPDCLRRGILDCFASLAMTTSGDRGITIGKVIARSHAKPSPALLPRIRQQLQAGADADALRREVRAGLDRLWRRRHAHAGM